MFNRPEVKSYFLKALGTTLVLFLTSCMPVGNGGAGKVSVMASTALAVMPAEYQEPVTTNTDPIDINYSSLFTPTPAGYDGGFIEDPYAGNDPNSGDTGTISDPNQTLSCIVSTGVLAPGQTTPVYWNLKNSSGNASLTYTLTGNLPSGVTDTGSITSSGDMSLLYRAPESIPEDYLVTITARTNEAVPQFASCTVRLVSQLSLPPMELQCKTNHTYADPGGEALMAWRLVNAPAGQTLSYSFTSYPEMDHSKIGDITPTSTTQVTYKAPEFVPELFTVLITASTGGDVPLQSTCQVHIYASPPVIPPDPTTVPTLGCAGGYLSVAPGKSVDVLWNYQNVNPNDPLLFSFGVSEPQLNGQNGELTPLNDTSARYTAPNLVDREYTAYATATSLSGAVHTTCDILVTAGSSTGDGGSIDPTKGSDDGEVPPPGDGDDGGNIPPGDGGGNVPPTDDGGDLPPNDGGGDVPPGDDNGDVPPGDDNGDVPPGDDNGDVPPGDDNGGNDNGDIPPGDDNGGNDNGNIPPGDDNGGNDNGDIPPGDDNGGNDDGGVPPGDDKGGNDDDDDDGHHDDGGNNHDDDDDDGHDEDGGNHHNDDDDDDGHDEDGGNHHNDDDDDDGHHTGRPDPELFCATEGSVLRPGHTQGLQWESKHLPHGAVLQYSLMTDLPTGTPQGTLSAFNKSAAVYQAPEQVSRDFSAVITASTGGDEPITANCLVRVRQEETPVVVTPQALNCATENGVLKRGQTIDLHWDLENATPNTPLSYTMASTLVPAPSKLGTLTPLTLREVTYKAPAEIGAEQSIIVTASTTGANSVSAECTVRLIPDEDIAVVDDGRTRGLVGNVYIVEEWIPQLPDLSLYTPVQQIVLSNLDVPTRSFSAGFPGVRDLFEWFAIRLRGQIIIEDAGRYQFEVHSDDGANLYIDGDKVVDNDGIHAPRRRQGWVELEAGVHDFQMDYYQGPRYHITLQLLWRRESIHPFQIVPPENFVRPLE